MAIQSFRFVGPGITQAYLQNQVDPSAVLSYLAGGAVVNVDVDDTDPGAVAQLTQTMAARGFAPGTSLPRPAGLITVGMGGDIDHTSVAAAVNDAVGRGASPLNPYLVNIYPGTYVEPPFALPTGVVVSSTSGEPAVFGITIVAADPLNDLITMEGGAIQGVTLMGVTDPGKALMHVYSAGTSIAISVTLQGCSNGVILEPNSGLFARSVGATVFVPGMGVGTVFLVKGPNTALYCETTGISVPPQILPAYPGVNPIERGIVAIDGAIVNLTEAYLNVSHNTPTQVSLLADSGAQVSIVSSTFNDAATAIQIGAGAGASKVTMQGGRFQNNTTNFQIDSAVGEIFVVATVDDEKSVLVPGARLSGIINKDTNGSTDLLGQVDVRYPTAREASLPDFVRDEESSGYMMGGFVTAAAGLTVDVTAGEGWVVRTAPDSDAQRVTWAADPALAVPANTTSYVFVSGATLALAVDTTLPGPESILLATVVTDGAAVRFVHNTRLPIQSSTSLLGNYLAETTNIILASGLAATPGTAVRKFQVDQGAYYVALERQAYVGSGGDATFSAFYGAGGANEIAGQTDVNITDYDNAGALAAMPAGEYRADTLYLTSDGRLSLIFGTATYAMKASAEAVDAASAPPFIEPSGIPLALVIVQQGNGIVSFVDLRPRSLIGGAATSGVTDHGLLSGLADDDHPQYLLASGGRPMAGNLNMGGFAVTNAGAYNGVTVAAHAVRHQPGGADAIATGVPVDTNTANAEGVAAALARQDHVHRTIVRVQDEGAAASSRPTINFIGNTVSVADNPGSDRADVTISAPALTGAAPTTVAIGDVANVGVATDAARADHTHAFPAPAAPADVTKSAASAGAATTVARSDHKHDISTAAPSSTGTANSEGTATSLARSDHVHRTLVATQQSGVAIASRPTLNFIGAAVVDNNADDRIDITVTGSGLYRQSVQALISADQSTNSAVFSTILTANITLGTAGVLLIQFSAATRLSNNGSTGTFRILVDGAAPGGVSAGAAATAPSANSNEGYSVTRRVTGLAAGTHTVTVQWKVSAGTMRVFAASNGEAESASLLLQEVAS